MDQSGSHVSPSEVGSEGHSETRTDTRSALELEALQHVAFNHDSETPSEQNMRQAQEASYIGSPKTIQGYNGEEDESESIEDSNEEDKEESKALQAVGAKSTKPSGGGPEGRGVDG